LERLEPVINRLMKGIKYELQNIILGNDPVGETDKIKTVQRFLRGNAEISGGSKKQKPVKKEEEKHLLTFCTTQHLWVTDTVYDDYFITEGAEQKVYRFNDFQVMKTNDAIFYETWLDYFNNLLIHNYLFPITGYELIGFKIIGGKLYAVVRQDFIPADEPTDLNVVNQFLEFNGFRNTRNHDYYNPALGIIFEDLHDENVLSHNKILFFVDTVFYLTEDFYELHP